MRKLVILMAALACLLSGTAFAAGDVVAVVNGEPLSRSDFTLALVDSVGRTTVDSFVESTLVEQEAARKGVTVTPQEVEARTRLEIDLCVTRIIEMSRLAPEEYRTLISTRGSSEEQVRKELAQYVSPEGMRVRLLAEKLLRPHIEITDAQVRRYYEQKMGERCLAAHILAPSEQLAQAILKRVSDNPTAWTEAVLRYSLDRASAPYKGRLPPLPASSKLAQVMKDMKPGEMKVHNDSAGWHVLRFIARVPASQTPFDAVKDSLKHELYCRRVDSVVSTWMAALNARASVVTNLSSDPATRRLLGEDVAVFVDGQAVPMSRFGEALAAQFGGALIGPFIERSLILQKARRAGVQVSDDAVQGRMSQIADEIFADQAAAEGMTTQELEDNLSSIGVNADRYRKLIADRFVSRENVRAMLLAEAIVQKDVEVTEAEVRRVYDAHFGERVDVRRVILPTADRAEEVRQMALAGADVATLAQTQSVEPQAWMHKGLLSGVTAGHPYWPQVKDLQIGAVSDVFEHYGSFCVLKVIARHAPSAPPALETVRDEMLALARAEKVRVRIRAWLEMVKAESQIEVKL